MCYPTRKLGAKPSKIMSANDHAGDAELQTGRTPREAERILRMAAPRFASISLAPIGTATANYVYRTDTGEIVRFPRKPWVAERFRAERWLLARLAPRISVRIPDLTYFGEAPIFMCYPEIPGSPAARSLLDTFDKVRRDAFARSLGRFLVELHAQPAAEHGDLPTDYGERIIARLTAERHSIAARDGTGIVGRVLEGSLDTWRRLMVDEAPPVLLHQDLHGQNLICDPATGELVGVVDFTLAWIGDPHFDFPEILQCGDDILERVLEIYEPASGRPIDRRRVAVLWALQLCHSLCIAPPGSAREAEVIARIHAFAGRSDVARYLPLNVGHTP